MRSAYYPGVRTNPGTYYYTVLSSVGRISIWYLVLGSGRVLMYVWYTGC